MKTIVVTGGAGYIGSHTIVEILERTKFRVVSIDNFSNSSKKTFERIKVITGTTVLNYSVDLCNTRELKKVFEKENSVIGIIHFAAYKSVPESVSNPGKYYSNNINSLLNILNVCTTYNIPNFIFSSSCSVYGNSDQLPINERTPWGKAESPYAYTKQIGETILKDFLNVNKLLKGFALRYFNPVGAHISGSMGEDPINPPTNLVPIITRSALSESDQFAVHGDTYDTRDGSCIRDYIHVTDVAVAHIKAIEALTKMEEGEKNDQVIINLGSGNGTSVFEAIKSFEKVTGIRLNYKVGPKRTGDVMAIYSDTSLAQSVLNWHPEFDLDQMMLSAWKWQLNLKNEQE